MRLQKYLAEAGIASRRAGETLITAGRVGVNGVAVVHLGSQVDPEQDRVTVDGTPVRVRKKLYVALHKPRGYLCTRKDPQHRHTVGELLPREWANLYPVGRLDRETEGLLFLTNDGEFCLRLTHPRYGVRKRYVVEVEGRIPDETLSQFARGVRDRAEWLKAESARLVRGNNTRSSVELELREGKYREVRRLCELLGLRVLRLQRVQIGPVKLGELPVGRWRVLTAEERHALCPDAE
jgi:23S rRNA pseudouridine2605 synthase